MYEPKGSKVRRRVLGERADEKIPRPLHQETLGTHCKHLDKREPSGRISEKARFEKPQVSPAHWWGALAFVTLLSIATRLYKIEVPSQIW